MKICISNKFLGDGDEAGLGLISKKQLLKYHFSSDSHLGLMWKCRFMYLPEELSFCVSDKFSGAAEAAESSELHF